MSDTHEPQEPPMVAESGLVALLNQSEINQQISTARRFPRSLKRFADEAMQMVTLNEQIAQECIYALPRKEKGQLKTIEGPSARFAEIIVSAWGNSRAGARVISDHGEFVTAQGVFHDLERNVAITYEVQRRITTSGGQRFSTDMIGVTANAACSIALRNAILKGVPKAFWSMMYDAARKTVMGDVKTLVNRRSTAVAEFLRYGITEAQLCDKLGVAGMADVGLDHLLTLRGLLTALKEGDTSPEDMFSSAPAATAGANAGPRMPQPRATTKAAPQPKAETPTPKAPEPMRAPVPMEHPEGVPEHDYPQPPETLGPSPDEDMPPFEMEAPAETAGDQGVAGRPQPHNALSEAQLGILADWLSTTGRTLRDVETAIGAAVTSETFKQACTWLRREAGRQ